MSYVVESHSVTRIPRDNRCLATSAIRISQEDWTRNTMTRWPAMLIACCIVSLALGCRTPRNEVARLPIKHSVRSEQLHIISDIELGKQHPLVEDLVQLREDVGHELDLPMEGRDVVVYVFSDKAKYQRYLHATYPELPPRRAYFVGTPRELAVYTFWGDNIQEDLRHEFTHGLLHAQLKDVPLWLDEGLAEYFEIPRGTPNSVHRDYPQHIATAVGNGWQPDLPRLESLTEVSQMQRADYQESWAWVHFLMHGSDDSRQLLLDYLQELRDNPHPPSLSVRIADTFPESQARYLSHVTSLRPIQQAGYQREPEARARAKGAH